jgi:hypothetical protein
MHVAVFDFDGLTNTVGHGTNAGIPADYLRIFGLGSPGVAKEVDVEALAEAEPVLLAGIDQPLPAGFKRLDSNSLWHEKSLARRDRSIK